MITKLTSVLIVVFGFCLNTVFASDAKTAFLFSFFREPNGRDGLHLAWSTNGLQWSELKAPGKLKDETKNPVKKNLRIAEGMQPEGPFGPAGDPIGTNRVEGPSAIQMDNEYLIYFDHYVAPRYYGAVKSSDLKHGRDVSSQVSFPPGIRHGTILKVPESVIQQIQSLNQ